MKNEYLPRRRTDDTQFNNRRRIFRRIVSILAIVTVFCTTYAMILPAVTLGSLPSLTDDGAYVSYK